MQMHANVFINSNRPPLSSSPIACHIVEKCVCDVKERESERVDIGDQINNKVTTTHTLTLQNKTHTMHIRN